jgi:LemA protein
VTLLAIVIALALLAWAMLAFNRLVRLRNQWRTAWADRRVREAAVRPVAEAEAAVAAASA